jgi:hypothetical protein
MCAFGMPIEVGIMCEFLIAITGGNRIMFAMQDSGRGRARGNKIRRELFSNHYEASAANGRMFFQKVQKFPLLPSTAGCVSGRSGPQHGEVGHRT